MEGTAKVFDAVDDMGTDGGGGMRCCSSTPTIRLSPRAQIVKEKKTYPTDLNSSPSESQVPPSKDALPTPAQLLNRPPPPPSSPRSHGASTTCASWAASCSRPALAPSCLRRSLISYGLEAVAPKIVVFLKLEEIALDAGEKQAKGYTSAVDW